jgi:hypothetical protein
LKIFLNSYKDGVPGYLYWNGREVLQANLVLNAFSAYMNSLTLNFNYDSAIALFKYNLIKLLIP